MGSWLHPFSRGAPVRWEKGKQAVWHVKDGEMQGKLRKQPPREKEEAGIACGQLQKMRDHDDIALALNLFGLTGLLCQVSPNLTPADSREASWCAFTLSKVF